MGTVPPVPVAPVMVLVPVLTVTVAPTPLTMRVAKLLGGAPPVTVMLDRLVGVLEFLTLTVSVPDPVLRNRLVLWENSMDSKLSTATRPLLTGSTLPGP